MNYNDKNYTHYNESSHPQRAGIAYFDKHPQPSNDDCVGSLLKNVIYFILHRLQSMGNGRCKVYGEFLGTLIKPETLNMLYLTLLIKK